MAIETAEMIELCATDAMRSRPDVVGGAYCVAEFNCR
jgi:hypothetical protein